MGYRGWLSMVRLSERASERARAVAGLSIIPRGVAAIGVVAVRVAAVVVREMRHAQLAPARVAHAIVAIVAELDVLDLLHLIGRVPDPVGQRVSAVLAHALKAAALLVALLEPSHDLCHVLVHVLLLLVVVIVITHQRVVLRLRAGDAVRVLELYARRLLVVGELDLVPRREEGVESEDELAVPVEELQHAVDDAGRVDRLRLELLHDVEELVVDMRLLLELHLDPVDLDLPALCRLHLGNLGR
mmetsp:Transcript_30955/g.101110  ORF Transcript_30955/g.101110 Transcript_30955/m.101110 type:complete len:244 (-) Transcript_30955:368-1099(-)